VPVIPGRASRDTAATAGAAAKRGIVDPDQPQASPVRNITKG